MIQKIYQNFRSLNKEFIVIWKFFYNNFAAYVFLFIQNYLINKYMPQESLGQFSYIHSLLVLFASVYSMEAYSAYLRFIGVNNEKSVKRIVDRILVVASVLFSITVVLFLKEPLYILFFGYMWMRERLYFFRTKMEINTYGQIKIVQYFLSTFSLCILVATGALNEKTMLLCMGISYLLVSLFYRFNKKAKLLDVSQDNLTAITAKEIIKYALPLAFNAIVVWILGAADQALIDGYLDAATLTYYSVGFRIINVIRIGAGVIMEYWPRFYFENMERKEFMSVKKMYWVFQGFIALLCLGSIVLSKQLYWVMGAAQYTEHRWMFCILAAAELFRQWGSINITFQSFMKNNTINVVCLSVLGTAKLVINWLTIESMGVEILLWTMLSCYILYYICSLFFGTTMEIRYIKNMKQKMRGDFNG